MRPPFIIQVRDPTHPSNGAYLAPVHSRRSYVKHPMEARRYDTKEAAEADACENEVVRSLPALINL